MDPLRITCRICEEQDIQSGHYFSLQSHLERAHPDISWEEYVQRYDDASRFPREVWESWQRQAPERQSTQQFQGTIQIGDIQIDRMYEDPIQTFKRPDHFQYPQKGDAGDAMQRLARALKYGIEEGRAIWLHGEAGTGKSSAVRALGHDLGLECSYYSLREGQDPELYLGKEKVVIDEETGQNKTLFRRGPLLQDLRGREGPDGERRPVLILLDDMDRAPPRYHEIFRHVLDDTRSIRVANLPDTIEIHPRTLIVATANSVGTGDDVGRYHSVEVVDASIRDRFDRFIEFDFLEAEEERRILERKFPAIAEQHGEVLDDIMDVAGKIREAIQKRELFLTFSHRRLEDWLTSLRELLAEHGYYKGIARDAAQDWLERYGQARRESVLQRLTELHTHPQDDESSSRSSNPSSST